MSHQRTSWTDRIIRAQNKACRADDDFADFGTANLVRGDFDQRVLCNAVGSARFADSPPQRGHLGDVQSPVVRAYDQFRFAEDRFQFLYLGDSLISWHSYPFAFPETIRAKKQPGP